LIVWPVIVWLLLILSTSILQSDTDIVIYLSFA
jgi:hypothetical protein